MTQFDRILTSQPVNKQAAMVAGGQGTIWQSNFRGNPHARKWDAPPPCVPIPAGRLTETFEDLTGLKIGRMTIIGYLGKLNPKKKALWLARCVCGTYESRGAKAIKNAMPNADLCEDCRYLERVKRGDSDLRPRT